MTTLVYTTEATATGGGRNGHSGTSNGRLSLDLSVPKEMGGDNGPGTNPEELFATGYAACFLGALNRVASLEKTKLPQGTSVTVTVSLATRDDGGFTIVPKIAGHLPGLDAAAAGALLAKAHAICPYSHLITVPHEVELVAA